LKPIYKNNDQRNEEVTQELILSTQYTSYNLQLVKVI